MIAGLEIPTSGRILLDGEDVTNLRAVKRDIAFVFQLFALYPHMNVRQNLAFPLKSQGTPRREIRRAIEEVAKLLRIDHLLNQPVSRLAGGDRQRVALGRAIIRRPKAFLMDEPLGALDAEFRELMCEELRRLHDRIDATTVYVTHDQVEAMTLGHRLMVLNGGHVEQLGTPIELYDRPATVFVAGFIGSPSMNFIEAVISADGSCAELPGDSRVALAEGYTSFGGRGVTLGLRPEHLHRVEDNAAGPRFTAQMVEHLGADTLVHGALGENGADITLRLSGISEMKAGNALSLAIEPRNVHVFDPGTGLRLP
jgi:multiple sugar transport system ATP-binding protein